MCKKYCHHRLKRLVISQANYKGFWPTATTLRVKEGTDSETVEGLGVVEGVFEDTDVHTSHK